MNSFGHLVASTFSIQFKSNVWSASVIMAAKGLVSMKMAALVGILHLSVTLSSIKKPLSDQFKCLEKENILLFLAVKWNISRWAVWMQSLK